MKKGLKIVLLIVLMLVIAAVVVFFVVIDKEKAPISAQEFYDEMEDEGYVMVDVTAQYASYGFGNYDIYSLTSNGDFMYLCRIDNTLLYIDVEDIYKDEVKEIIDELDY